MRDETATSRTVDLYMGASESTRDRRRGVVARLEALQSTDRLDRFTVRTWPRRVTTDGPNEDVVSLVTRLERWAEDADASLAPAFERRRYDRSFTDESGELLSLPTVALAVYESDELVEVAPRVEGATTVTVDDVIDIIEPQAEAPPVTAVADERS